MPTTRTLSLGSAAIAFVAVTLVRVVDAFYRRWRGDNLEATIVGSIVVLIFALLGFLAFYAVLRKKYPTWDGRTFTKNAISKADRDITRTKLFLVLFAFGVLATLLWIVCLAVYADNLGGDTDNIAIIIVWLAALPAANYTAYKVAMAVLRRKHPTWNGKIPPYKHHQPSHASVE